MNPRQTEIEQTIKRQNRIIEAAVMVALVCFASGIFVAWCFIHHGVPGSQNTPTPNNWINAWATIGTILQGTTGLLWSLGSFCLIFVAFMGQERQNRLRDLDNIKKEERYTLERKEQEERFNQQRIEFQMELKAASDRHEEHRKQFQLQQVVIERQSFEDSLFRIIGFHYTILESIEYKNVLNVQGKGRAALDHIYNAFKNAYRAAKPIPANDSDADFLKAFYIRHSGILLRLTNLFTNLIYAMRFIESVCKTPKVYHTFLFAQLSQQEQVLLFYAVVCNDDLKDVKAMTEKWGLFAHLDRGTMLFSAQHDNPDFISVNAFAI